MSPERNHKRESGEEACVVVVGAGRFGSRALHEMLRRHPHGRLMVVDRDPRALAPWTDRGVMVCLGEAVEVLDRLLQANPPTWVVPAVPFHLAHACLEHRLSQSHLVQRISVPRDLPVPNALAGSSGDLYSSFATFICPEDCPEPRGTCTVTGEKRPLPLFRLLANLAIPGQRILGLRSHQLGPGVGGYRSRDLLALLETVESVGGDLVIYTACRCHGVLSGLRVGPRRKHSEIGSN